MSRLAIKKAKRGSIIYTEIYKGYDGVFKHKRIYNSKKLENRRYILIVLKVFGVIPRSNY
ncbi:MAG: hypothetical protein ACK4F9_02960 [Brevinematia bacterium]